MLGTTLGDIDGLLLDKYDGLGIGYAEGSADVAVVGKFVGLLFGV